MFFPTPVQPAERQLRLAEIDNKIENLSKVINTITGHKRSFFDNKLLTVKLKKQRMLALSAFAQAQTMQRVLAEIDSLVAENDLILEIDSLRNTSKKLLRRKRRRNEDPQEMLQGGFATITQTTQENPLKTSSSRPVFVFEDNIKEAPRRPEITPFVNQAIQPDLLNCQFKSIAKLPLLSNNSNTEPVFVAISTPALEVENMFTDEVDNNATWLTKPNHNDTADTLLLTCEDNDSALTQLAQKMEAATSKDIEEEMSRCKNIKLVCVSIAEDQTQNLESNIADTNVLKGGNGNETEEIGGATKSATHENIVNLFKLYKKIMMSETSPLKTAETSLSSNKLPATKVSKNSKDSSKTSKSSDSKDEQTTVKINITKSVKTSHRSDVTAKKSKTSLNVRDTITDKNKLVDSKKENSKRSHKKSRKSKDYKKGDTNIVHSKDLSHSAPKTIGTKRLSGILTDANTISYKDRPVQLSSSAKSSKTQDQVHQSNSNEDIVNSLFRDLMASKRFKFESSSSSGNTATCFQCGQVNEGHMCAYTLREILEQC